jgi:hypothetical protein
LQLHSLTSSIDQRRESFHNAESFTRHKTNNHEQHGDSLIQALTGISSADFVALRLLKYFHDLYAVSDVLTVYSSFLLFEVLTSHN